MGGLTMSVLVSGAVLTGCVVALLLWAVRRIRILRESLLLHVDHDAGRVHRVPPWRLPIAAGVAAAGVTAAVFGLLAH